MIGKRGGSKGWSKLGLRWAKLKFTRLLELFRRIDYVNNANKHKVLIDV